MNFVSAGGKNYCLSDDFCPNPIMDIVHSKIYTYRSKAINVFNYVKKSIYLLHFKFSTKDGLTSDATLVSVDEFDNEGTHAIIYRKGKFSLFTKEEPSELFKLSFKLKNETKFTGSYDIKGSIATIFTYEEGLESQIKKYTYDKGIDEKETTTVTKRG